MGIVTNLLTKPLNIQGGETILVHELKVNHVGIHQIQEVASRLQIGLLESDSNNTTGVLVAADAKKINQAWTQLKFEWGGAKKFRNMTPSVIEKTYTFFIPIDAERLRCKNTKCRRVVDAVAQLQYFMAYCQSASLEVGIGEGDIADIEERMSFVEYWLTAYVGTGARKEDGGADTGMDVPDYPRVGQLNPEINNLAATLSEASPGAPDLPAADAPDVPSSINIKDGR